jgi:excisionase family DNA binding protein
MTVMKLQSTECSGTTGRRGREDLFTTGRLAQYLGCSERHIFNLRRRGLPAFEIGDMVRFDLAAVRGWLSAHQTGTTKPKSA